VLSELRKAAARIVAVSTAVEVTEAQALALLKEQLELRLIELLAAANTLHLLHLLEKTTSSTYKEEEALKELSDDQFVVFVEARAVQQILKHL